jgi:hypothetical protein
MGYTQKILHTLYRLSKEVTQEDLTQARTTVFLDHALITTSDFEKIEVEFT